jgi:hypothetical protein
MQKYLKWTAALLFVGLALLLVLFVLAASNQTVYKLLVSEETRTRCYGISDKEARDRIYEIFADELRRSENGVILVDVRPARVYVSEIYRDKYGKGDGFYSTSVVFADRNSKREVLTATIHEDCDVQWLPADPSDPNPGLFRTFPKERHLFKTP